MQIDVRVQTEDFSIDREWSACRDRIGGKGGAIVAFGGLVREFAREERVQRLFLEHYPGMTESSIAGIVEEAGRRWPLLDVVVIHRVGELEPSDQIVLVLVASAHRPAAFAACEFVMDYLKTRAVFWKKELGGTGETWIRSTDDDRERAEAWGNGAGEPEAR